MSSPDNTFKRSHLSSISTQRMYCPECQEVVSVDEHTQIQSSQENGKFIADTKGLPVCLMWKLRPQVIRDHYYLSGEKTVGVEKTVELIRNWETRRGKRALLCGVTYDKQKHKLKGTDYDVKSMKELLRSQFGFPERCIHILSEKDGHPYPTKRNIQEALRWLVKDNQEGDSLVFYFSGHGLRQPDFFEDERDGFDETICPLDFRTAGMIIDNEINDTIVRPLKKGVKLHAIIDACHSGTILDLPHIYNTKEKNWEDNSPPSGVYKGTNGGRAVSLSACEDNQLAADTSAFSESGKQMEGAMTYTFKKAVKDNPRVTYASLMSSIHKEILAAGAKCFSLRGLFHRERLQEPLLSSSEVFDINEEFVL